MSKGRLLRKCYKFFRIPMAKIKTPKVKIFALEPMTHDTSIKHKKLTKKVSSKFLKPPPTPRKII